MKRLLIASVCALGATGFLHQTYSFSTATINNSTAYSVVDEENALISIKAADYNFEAENNGSKPVEPTLTIKNNSSKSISLGNLNYMSDNLLFTWKLHNIVIPAGEAETVSLLVVNTEPSVKLEDSLYTLPLPFEWDGGEAIINTQIFIKAKSKVEKSNKEQDKKNSGDPKEENSSNGEEESIGQNALDENKKTKHEFKSGIDFLKKDKEENNSGFTNSKDIHKEE
ncbi:hypothetical protein IMZ08_03765 [Bacillus luteolus]|uniref:Uncharacterized protein n=1 Tax=Litchfieldia luteola TaxID=682179 RepID=A0ABR9QFA6_9BACI|nr:hypothetical protein [Cytobacillus luteolus]MBE4907175.1 hypothetical protein [Cytobacillus luteolus]MBP1943354.1 hypothetical protein [Cytobacillus luteolus]